MVILESMFMISPGDSMFGGVQLPWIAAAAFESCHRDVT